MFSVTFAIEHVWTQMPELYKHVLSVNLQADPTTNAMRLPLTWRQLPSYCWSIWSERRTRREVCYKSSYEEFWLMNDEEN